jgi:peptidoglycan hydrolase CwlO-like protein
VKQVTKKLVSTHEETLNNNDKTLSSLHHIKQNLTREKVYLEGTLGNAQTSSLESFNKLERVVKEIESLNFELTELRKKIDDVKNVKDENHVFNYYFYYFFFFRFFLIFQYII